MKSMKYPQEPGAHAGWVTRRISGLGSCVARGPQGETTGEIMKISAGEQLGICGKILRCGCGWDLVHARLIRFQVQDGLYQLFLPDIGVIWFWDLDPKQLPILVLNHHQGKWANHGCTILHETHWGVWVIWSCLIFQNWKSVSCTWKFLKPLSFLRYHYVSYLWCLIFCGAHLAG